MSLRPEGLYYDFTSLLSPSSLQKKFLTFLVSLTIATSRNHDYGCNFAKIYEKEEANK